MCNRKYETLTLAAIITSCSLAGSIHAQTEAPLTTGTSRAALGAPVPDSVRPCVLLRNDNVLFGHAQQVGEFVVVKTGHGGEVKLPRRDVACWAASIRDLYRYRIDHRPKGSVSAHLRDATWCMRHDLFDLAAAEIRAVYELDPKNAQASRMEHQLKRTVAAAQPAPTKPAIGYEPHGPNYTLAGSESGNSPMTVQSAGFRDDRDHPQETGNVDLTTLRGFASHVQPMLVNRCGRCHSDQAARSGKMNVKWALVLPPIGSRASSRMTRENLTATLPYVDALDPNQSELLIKATSPHGGSGVPLDARSAKAITALKNWLALAGAAVPISEINMVDHTETRSDAATVTPFIAERPQVDEVDSNPSGTVRQPARLPQVANPFDPDLFNRRFHPQQ